MFEPTGGLLVAGMQPGVGQDNLADAKILKVFHLPAEKTREEMTMKTGVEFLQRMQEDAEFRQKVKACPNGAVRMAFLQSEGYDFSPFVQIIDSLSSDQRPTGGLARSGESASPKQGASGFVGRISQIFRAPKAPRPDR
jgi:hypothetical protein